MDGVVELAEEIFHTPVRLGLPHRVSGLVDVVRNPIHATGVGLLLYALEQRAVLEPGRRAWGNFNGIWAKVKTWFQGGV